MSAHGNKRQRGVLSQLLGQVAFWQAMGFLALIGIVWALEVLDLPAAIYGAPETPVDWISASLLTAGILVMAIIVVGHTYLQQQRILRGFIRVCSYCRKVHVEATVWEPIELFVSERTLAEFTHGICPDCLRAMSARVSQDAAELKRIQDEAQTLDRSPTATP
mgnify:CR=1 FL=1